MGAYAPVEDVSPELLDEIKKTVLLKCLQGMESENRTFVGVLFAGLMLTEDEEAISSSEEGGAALLPKIHVLEYNCRFGDPETQAVMPLIEGDLYQVCLACTQGRLDQVRLPISKGYCCAVVLASGGYPGPIQKNKTKHGLSEIAKMPSTFAFHAGTKIEESTGDDGSDPGKSLIKTSGGRVIAISSLARSMEHAIRLAYLGV